jgi:hypothetical protein
VHADTQHSTVNQQSTINSQHQAVAANALTEFYCFAWGGLIVGKQPISARSVSRGGISVTYIYVPARRPPALQSWVWVEGRPIGVK